MVSFAGSQLAGAELAQRTDYIQGLQLILVPVCGLPKQLGSGRCFSVRPFPGHKPPIVMWLVGWSLLPTHFIHR